MLLVSVNMKVSEQCGIAAEKGKQIIGLIERCSGHSLKFYLSLM